MWFYEWTHAETRKQDAATNVLATCNDGECQETSVKSTEQSDEGRLVSGSSEAISKQKNVKNQQNTLYHTLLRDVVTDLATSFKHES